MSAALATDAAVTRERVIEAVAHATADARVRAKHRDGIPAMHRSLITDAVPLIPELVVVITTYMEESRWIAPSFR